MPKNGGFRIFLGIHSLPFSETLQLIRAFNKNCPKLAIWLDAAFLQDAGIAGNPRKKRKVDVFESDFKQVPFVFQQTTCTYSES